MYNSIGIIFRHVVTKLVTNPSFYNVVHLQKSTRISINLVLPPAYSDSDCPNNTRPWRSLIIVPGPYLITAI